MSPHPTPLQPITRNARPALEHLEDRVTPSTLLYIDQAADFSITVDQGAPGLDAGDTVTWNPGGAASPVAGLTFGTDAFSSIQSAVNAAAALDTLILGNGFFFENVNINKDLTLLSANGRANTTIVGLAGAGALGTVQITNNTTAVQIGAANQGVTILGFDNGAPGLENAAVYVQGDHSGLQLLHNEIYANGDNGFLTEYGRTITGFTLDSNIFSGQTFVGPLPGGNGFGSQFTTPNVPRQLVVIGSGGGAVASGSGLASDITFTNNQIIGRAGGVNEFGEQGNSLVTIDAGDSTITGNTFAGTTTRFGSALRVRRPDTVISGNTFNTSNMTLSTNSLFVQNNTTPLQDIVAANTFDRGAFRPNGDTVWQAIQGAVAGLVGDPTAIALPGTYTENLTVTPAGVTLSPAGNSTGVVNIVGGMNLIAGTFAEFQVNGTTPGTQHDQVNVTGTVNLGGATLNLTGTLLAGFGQEVILIANDEADPVAGQFAGLAEGSVVNFNGQSYTLSYVGGTGNDVTLTRLWNSVSTPPPAPTPPNYFAADQRGDYIRDLYLTLLGRPASGAEVANWIWFWDQTGSNVVVANGIYQSFEHRLRQVDSYYRNLLGRTASNPELVGWAQAMVNGLSEEQVEVAFLTSPEFSSIKDNTTYVNSLYQILLKRTPDSGSLNYWVQDLNNGLTREQLVRSIIGSQEYAGNVLNDLYLAYLGRLPDSSGFNFWLQNYVAGTVSAADLAFNLLVSQEFLNKTRV